jgi:hypothetical protein
MEVEEEMERVRLCETGRRKRKRLISCYGFLYLICLSCVRKEMSDSGKFEDKRLQPHQSSCPNPVFHVDSL